MGWRRQRRDTHDELEQEPGTQDAIKAAWSCLVEEEEVASDRLERHCTELGALGWEVVSALSLSHLGFSSGGHTTGMQLFFKRRSP
jgi:hypothetical protein